MRTARGDRWHLISRDEDTSGSDQDNQNEDEEARIVMSELERCEPCIALGIANHRLHIQHDAIKLALDGRLYTAPLTSGHVDILESANGPGIWAIDTAKSASHECNVSLHTLDHGSLLPLPDNCNLLGSFIPINSFDLVYARGLVAAGMATTEHISSLISSLRDGGYLELVEIETTLHEHDQVVQSATSQWVERLNSLQGHTNIQAILTSASENTKRSIRVVSSSDTELPLGEWPSNPTQRHIGQLLKSSFLSFFNNVSAPIALKYFGWDQSDIALNQYQVRSEWDTTPPRKFFFNMRIIIVQVA